MRKMLLAIGLATAMLSAPVMAEESTAPDYSSMSIEALVAMRDDINTELQERIGGKDQIGAGMYVCGKDIKPGKYLLTDTKGSDDVFRYVLYESMEAKENYETLDYNALDAGVDVTLNLTDGMVVSLDGSAYIESINPSWAMD